jgi:DNA polymerase-3 subunit gamma/tau
VLSVEVVGTMALALYRKYRPRTFAEVIGQEHVTEPLTQALRTGRMHHAYLFSGPRGCGKTSSARILARSLNCEKGPTPDPCGECESCRSLAPDGPGSIDVIEIDAASHGGVDDARDLRERAFFAPVAGRYKVYVIDEAHMVSSAGFNALLKLVEEPPEFVKFVFATTEPEKVLGTIKSRTHHYPFRLIPPGVLRPYLEELCLREGVTVEPAVFPLVVRAGAGSARDSLSVLDQLIAGAGDEGVTYLKAAALLGVTDAALIDEMCDALTAGDGAAAYAVIDRVAEAGHDSRRFASDLLERLRDLIVLQNVPDAAAKGLLDAPEDQLSRMSLQAQRFGPATLSRSADIVHNGLVEMRGTTAPRLLLELITARMLLPGADDSQGGLLHRLERMERRLGAASPATSAPAPTVDPSAGPSPAAGPEGTTTSAGPQTGATAAPAAAASTPSAVPAPPATSGTARPGAARPGPSRPDPPPPDPPRRGPTPEGPAPRSGAAAGQSSAEHSSAPRTVPPPPVPSSARATAPGRPATVPAASGPESASAQLSGPLPAQSPPGQIDAAAVRRVWEEILTAVGRKSKRAAAVVREATVREVEGDTLVLAFRHAVHADMLTASPELLVAAVREVLGGQWQVRCELSGAQRAPRGAGAPAPTQAPAAAAGAGLVTDPASDTEWPTPATPGGAPAFGPPAPSSPSPAPARVPSRSRSSTSAAGSADSSGRTSAKAARGRGPGPANGRGRAATPRTSGQDSAWDDGPPPDEPGFDPGYQGFDPGDEPLDDVVDEHAARQTSEEQALQLLQQTLGAEKIAEIDHH